MPWWCVGEGLPVACSNLLMKESQPPEKDLFLWHLIKYVHLFGTTGRVY